MKLTHIEALYLYDALSMFDPVVGREGQYPDILLKMGDAIILTKGGGETIIVFTLPELWAIREHAKSSVKVGAVNVGLDLIYKLVPEIGELMRGYNLEELQNMLKEQASGDTDTNQGDTGHEAPNST